MIYGIILAVLSFLDHPIIGAVALLGIVVGLFLDRRLPLVLYIITLLLDCKYTTLQLFLAMAVVSIGCILIIVKTKSKLSSKYMPAMIIFIVSFILSFLIGIKTESTIALFFLFSLLICYSIAVLHGDHQEEWIKQALLIGGVAMMVIMLSLLLTGGMYNMFRRLSFHENIKIIAMAVAFPIFHLVWELVNNFASFKLFRKILYITLILLCLFIIILTYARGALLALVVSIACMLFTRFRSFRFQNLFFIGILAVGAFFVIDKMSVDTELMFERIEGGNGRTDIWANFYNIMKQDGVWRVLFGFGPGDLRRIVPDVYAHSAILDYFFSFGAIGFMCFLTILLKTAVHLFKQKEMYCFCLLILCLFMYFPHGAAHSTHFYCLLGLCLLNVPKKIKKQNIVNYV